MKIWANELNVGDNIWYQSGYEFKNATIIEKSYDFKMPTFKLDNGELLFVNAYVYTDRMDITNELIDDVIDSCNKEVESYTSEIIILSDKIAKMKQHIYKLKQMKV